MCVVFTIHIVAYRAGSRYVFGRRGAARRHPLDHIDYLDEQQILDRYYQQCCDLVKVPQRIGGGGIDWNGGPPRIVYHQVRFERTGRFMVSFYAPKGVDWEGCDSVLCSPTTSTNRGTRR